MKKDETIDDRYKLAEKRIAELPEKNMIPEKYASYFSEVCDYYLGVMYYYDALSDDKKHLDLKTKKHLQDVLFYHLDPTIYEGSFLNPDYALDILGDKNGGILSAVYADLTASYGWAAEKRKDLITIGAELIIELYGDIEENYDYIATVTKLGFDKEKGLKIAGRNISLDKEKGLIVSEEEIPFDEDAAAAAVKDAVVSFYHDYTDIFTRENVNEMIDPSNRFFTNIVKNADLSTCEYLYDYGAYIGDNEVRLHDFMNTLSEEEVDAMADTFTEGYRTGFAVTGKDISKKKTVGIEYPVGLERMVRKAVENFEKMGLSVTMKREPVLSMTGRGQGHRGVYSSGINRQFLYDHKNDKGYYFDKAYVERKIEVVRDAYSKRKKKAAEYGGPAVIEVFGEKDFTPVNKPSMYQYSRKQDELSVYERTQIGQITNEYIHEDERSFTIISFPLPSIGKDFEAIFKETLRINTLDYKKYQQMQAKIIAVLDKGVKAHVVGAGDNKTDITVSLHPLDDPKKQTIFENCVADVNIPVGEVFTSPVLEGTEGTLNVSKAYLGDYVFDDLTFEFKDGRTVGYSCTNFDSNEENRKFIFDNILFKHDSLPLGEFAIGTNTTAYKMGIEYGIQRKLPILIAEKTGPHFALGDTCYSYAEDVPMYNPDGKECVARDNSVSALRKTDPSKAYFNCHTDITIPYDELALIEIIAKNGKRIPIIKDGRFTVAGCEELNEPLDELDK